MLFRDHGAQFAPEVEVARLRPPVAGLEIRTPVRDAPGLFMRDRIQLPPQVDRGSRILNDASNAAGEKDRETDINAEINSQCHACSRTVLGPGLQLPRPAYRQTSPGGVTGITCHGCGGNSPRSGPPHRASGRSQASTFTTSLGFAVRTAQPHFPFWPNGAPPITRSLCLPAKGESEKHFINALQTCSSAKIALDSLSEPISRIAEQQNL